MPLLALLSSLLWGLSDFVGGTLTRRLPAFTVIGISQAIALAGLLPVAALTGAQHSGPGYLGWGVAAGLVGLVALGAFYSALATGTMGVVAPIAATGVVVPVAAGLAAGESPRLAQFAGIAVAVVGVVLASGPELAPQAGGGSRPLLLAAVAALGFGTVLVLVARGSRTSPLMTLVTMRVATVGLLSARGLLRRRAPGSGRARRSRSGGSSGPTSSAVAAGDRPDASGAPVAGQHSGVWSVVGHDPAAPRDPGAPVVVGSGDQTATPTRADLPVLAAVGLGDVGANAAFAVASRSGLVSVVAVLSSLYPAVTVLLARQVHGERLRRAQVAGVGAALVGVGLLAGG